MSESFYSSNYEEARRRFVEAAAAAKATLSRYSLSHRDASAEELSIDVAVLGPRGAPALVVSSGLHGVEGFLGSAIQLAMLDELKTDAVNNIRWVFIHAINPFGFAQIRRFNEDNVDLNRNFLLPGSHYSGAPADYDRLNALLNPKTVPSSYEPFRLKAFWNILRYGMGTLKQCIAAGQYEHPRGIFFGGAAPSQAMGVIRENCKQWIGITQKVLHVDFHSGLGAFGEYKLLLVESAELRDCRWYKKVFGHDAVQASEDAAYNATGTLGRWLQHRFADRDYRFVTAEFGTYGPIRVLSAIRAENCACHFGQDDREFCQNARQELMECFCPSNAFWRQKSITAGIAILRQGINGLRVRQ